MSIVIVFPGQGSQRTGMAQDFFEASPVARDVFAEASTALNMDVARLCFEEDDRLNLTEFTQPAILTAEIAMWRTLESEFGLKGAAFGGHSLGEYTALVAAEVIPLAQAVHIVQERGRRMQEAVPAGVGTMAAIMQADLSVSRLEACLSGLQVDIANHNAHNQVVISGEATAVEMATERYRDRPEGMSAKVRMLSVSAPFHSRMMAPIEPGFASLLFDASQEWSVEPSRCVTSNTSGRFHDGTREGLVDRLTRQISGTVRWVDNMVALCSLGPDRIIEVGPGRPLRGFFRGLGDGLGNATLDAITNLSSARRALATPPVEPNPAPPHPAHHSA